MIKIILHKQWLKNNVRVDPAMPRYRKSRDYDLIWPGSIASGESEATCATDLLASYSEVSISDSTGSTTCSSSSMDGCTDRTEMRYTYDAACGNTLKFSSELF